MNAIIAEAHFRLAQELGVLPREVQSVTWEAVRALFSPEAKRGTQFTKNIQELWRDHERGKLSLEDLRDAIYANAGGFDVPA